jgi:hypothetical protein
MGLDAAPGVDAASSPLVRARLRFARGAAPRLAKEELSRSGELSQSCKQTIQQMQRKLGKPPTSPFLQCGINTAAIDTEIVSRDGFGGGDVADQREGHCAALVAEGNEIGLNL